MAFSLTTSSLMTDYLLQLIYSGSAPERGLLEAASPNAEEWATQLCDRKSYFPKCFLKEAILSSTF
jgi:hypothetical protein